MVTALRRWVGQCLRALLAAIGEGVPVSVPLTPPVSVHGADVPAALGLTAREWVGRMDAAKATGVTKRLIAFRALRAAFPDVPTSRLNLAIEEAVQVCKTAPGTAKEEAVRG